MNNKKLSTTALAMIIFIAVFGFGNIANNYKEVGINSAVTFVVVALIFFLPMSLIMAEFGSFAKDRTAGIYSWIEIGMGKKVAYIAIWSYFVANIFYLPTLGTRVPTYLSFVIYGDANIGNTSMALLAALTMIIAVVIGIKYEKAFEKVSTFIGYLSLFVAFIFIAAGLYEYLFGNPSTVVTAKSFTIDFSSRVGIGTFLGTFSWIIFAFGGSELCGTYVDKIDNPERNFPRAILLSSAIIAVLYVAGIFAIASFGTVEEFSKVSLINAVLSGYKFMGDKLAFGMWFIRFVALSYVLITLVALVLWSVALSKAVFSEVPEGTFPHWLTAKNKFGVLQNALIFQTVLGLIFIAITTLGGDAAEELYSKIYDMSTMAFIVPYFFLALSYIHFRKIGHVSSFQLVKNKKLSVAIGMFLVLLIILSLIFSGIDISKPLSDQIETIKLYYGGLVMFLLIGYIIKFLNKKSYDNSNSCQCTETKK